jgi:hypothetical protein
VDPLATVLQVVVVQEFPTVGDDAVQEATPVGPVAFVLQVVCV